MSNMYICSENKTLSFVGDIQLSPVTPFVFRELNEDRIEELFLHNGSDLQFIYTEDGFISLMMDIKTDENNYIIDIGCHKHKDLTPGPGRPIIKDLTITKADYKRLVEVLSEGTIDKTEEEYQVLIESIQADDVLSHRIKSISNKNITMFDNNGNPISIKKSEIEWAIQVSHSYIDVLYSKQALMRNPTITEEKAALLLEILSHVDTSEYYCKDMLLLQYKQRKIRASAEIEYPKLYKAVCENNYEEAVKYQQYSCVHIREFLKDDVEKSPLMIAIKNDNIPMVKLLLENGVYARVYDRTQNIWPLDLAVSTRNLEIIKLLKQYNGIFCGSCYYGSKYKYNTDRIKEQITKNKDIELLRILSPDIFDTAPETWLDPNSFDNFTSSDIAELIEIDNARIAWPLNIILQYYEKDKSLCMKMIKQGCTDELIEYFIQHDNYEMFEAAMGSFEYVQSEKSMYEPLYERDKKWYDCLQSHTGKRILPNGKIRYMADDARDRFFVKILDNAEFDRFIRDIQLLDVQSFYGSLGNSHFILFPEKCKNLDSYRSFAHYMLDHYKFEQRYEFIENIVRYFGDEELTHKFNIHCPLKKPSYSPSVDAFWTEFIYHEFAKKYIEDKKVTMYAGAEIIRCSFGIEPFEKRNDILDKMVCTISAVCYSHHAPLSGPSEWKSRYQKATNCMKALLEKATLKELDEALMASEYRTVNSVAELFQHWKDAYPPMCQLLQEAYV